MQGDGDGWSAGPEGSRCWGLHGAAGLFLVSEDSSAVLMQHRAHWTANGGTWGIPGGARDSHESAAEAALREAREEAGVMPADVAVIGDLITAGPFPSDPDRPELAGDWTYTTVIASTAFELEVEADAESLELRWVRLDKLSELDLLPAFAKALPHILHVYRSN